MRIRRALAALGIVAALAIAGAVPAGADALRITSVDVTAFPVVTARVVFSGAAADPSLLSVQEDGRYIPEPKVERVPRSIAVGTAIVIDTSASMSQLNKIVQARALVRRVVAEKGPDDQLALVGAGQAATVLSPLTADPATLLEAVDRLVPAGETALDDGIRLAAGLFSSDQGRQANLLVVTDGRDTSSTGTFDEARATVLSARVAVRVLALAGAADFDPAPMKSIAAASGGTYDELRDPATIPATGAERQQNLANELLISYRSEARAPFAVTVGIGAISATEQRVSPAQVAQSSAITEETSARSIGPLRSRLGAVIVAGLFFLALGIAAFAGLQIFVPDRHEMDATLVGYSLHAVETSSNDRGDGSVISTPFVRRAVALTERVADRRGVLAVLESRLEMADLRLRAGEVALFTVVAAALLGIAVTALVGPVLGLAVAGIAIGLPFFALKVIASRRRRLFTSQLPDMLNLLAAVLRSGYAVLQGVDAVSREVAEPMAGELRRVLSEAQLGRDISDSLKDCADRMESADFDWAVMAIAIQREVGGNLAELLSTVADTMVQRERLRREVKGLTAEGRMSAYVLGLLTPGVGLAMFTMNPEYIEPLYKETLGQILLGGSILAAIGGFVWMNRMIQIDV